MSLFLYEAKERRAKFVVNSEGILLYREALARRHRSEVRAEFSVILAGNRDILAVEHMQIALCTLLRLGLDEREVLLVTEFLTNLVTSQYSLIVLTSKASKGLVVADDDLIGFPQNRFQMDIYYDGECFIYTDGLSKFIIHPNYQMKVSREVVKLVNFITATRRTDKKEFNGKRYIKI